MVWTLKSPMFLTLIFGKSPCLDVSLKPDHSQKQPLIFQHLRRKKWTRLFDKLACLDLWTIEGGSAIKMLSFTSAICGLSRMTTLKGGGVLTKMFPDLYSDTLEIATQYFTSKGPSFPSTGEKSPKCIRYSPCGWAEGMKRLQERKDYKSRSDPFHINQF